MPSTIAAGTTAGTAIAITGDTTGNLAFQTNGTTTAMTINTSQNVQLNAAAGKILNSSGNPILQQTGSVLQVVSASKTDSTSTTTTWVDITGMSVSITPTATSSKILILVSISTGSNNGSQFYRIVRDSTSICVGTSVGSREPVSLCNQAMQTNGNAMLTMHQNFLDSPSTTSATTYKIQWRSQGGTAYLNRSIDDTDNNNFPRGVSTITVMEIAG